MVWSRALHTVFPGERMTKNSARRLWHLLLLPSTSIVRDKSNSVTAQETPIRPNSKHQDKRRNYLKRLSSPKLKTGKYVKMNKQTTMARKAGSIAREIRSILSPDIADATKRFIP